MPESQDLFLFFVGAIVFVAFTVISAAIVAILRGNRPKDKGTID